MPSALVGVPIGVMMPPMLAIHARPIVLVSANVSPLRNPSEA
jgi:hypothetical protein